MIDKAFRYICLSILQEYINAHWILKLNDAKYGTEEPNLIYLV
jgi:hypothetical protein